MKNIKLYLKKLLTAEEAVKVIKSGDWVDFGWCTTTPVALDAALAKRMPKLNDVKIRGGILLWTPEIFKIENPQKHFVWNSWHMSGIERKSIDRGFTYYAPIRYSEIPRYYRDSKCKPNVAMFQVAPMDDDGFFNFGPSASHSKAVCDTASTIIVEVNENIPRCHGLGENKIHISQVDIIVEGKNPLLGEIKSNSITEIETKVANLIVEEISDGSCLQLGIGGMPNAVGALIAKSDLKDLGVHSEMYVDAFVDIANAGKINGSKKNIDQYKQTFAFAAGTQRLYDYINNNQEIISASVEYVNDIRTVSAIDKFMSINNAVNIDLFGQVNSESSGVRHISGAGGQLDFVLGAYLSRGGKSFICCSSTYVDKNGEEKSRILPTLERGSIVTDTRTNTHYLVTEYGKVNLKGLSTWQRCEAIISIAHPDFREELIREASRMNIWRRSNR
jgi:butyryl-CoA:acetate CoA-transferase